MGSLLYPLYDQTVQTQYDLSLLGLVSETSYSRSKVPNIKIIPSNSDLPSSLNRNNQTSVNKKYGYYFREGIGFYEFFDGCEMKVTPLTDDFGADFVRILLNYPMSCLLYQQGYFLLHGSAVEFQNKVYLFPGSSLCGKSTIAAYLVKNGGKLITEDTAAIKLTNKGAYISPSYPLIKLSEQANNYINLSNSTGIKFPLDKNARKGYLLDSSSFFQGLAKVDFCIFPEWCLSESKLEKLTFPLSIARLLVASLSTNPLDRTKEKQLLTANTAFLKQVRAYVYQRKQSFSSLKSLIRDLKKLQE